mmetsp:Transcript_8252/g.15205  ORF Transcript_8252/g.15205 Transcript_8252/m.15205 type:complete len:200 (+) Transcript_8252:314-913(+)
MGSLLACGDTGSNAAGLQFRTSAGRSGAGSPKSAATAANALLPRDEEERPAAGPRIAGEVSAAFSAPCSAAVSASSPSECSKPDCSLSTPRAGSLRGAALLGLATSSELSGASASTGADLRRLTPAFFPSRATSSPSREKHRPLGLLPLRGRQDRILIAAPGTGLLGLLALHMRVVSGRGGAPGETGMPMIPPIRNLAA